MTEAQKTLRNILALDETIDRFFSLAAARDISTMLQQALQTFVDTFYAQSGSLFFYGNPLLYFKVGDFPAPVLAHLTRLENVVADRLQNGVWRVLDIEMPPISVQKFSKQGVTLINTPLLKNTQVIGSLSLMLPDEVQFNLSLRTTLIRLTKGVGQLAAFANDLSLAQKRYKELDLIYQIGQALATTFNITELLEKVMELATNMLDAASASILLIDETGQDLVFEVSHTPKAAVLKKHRINLDEGIAGWVAKNDKPAIVNDVVKDPRFSKKVDARTGFLTFSIAAVPLKLKGTVVGVLEVLNKNSKTGFDNDDIRLMASIAAQTAIALENAKLYQNLRAEHDKIIKSQDDVRKELARNLHDGAVQQLSALSMNLEYAQKLLKVDPEAAYEELNNVRELAHKAAKDARLVLFELRPIILETEGLIPALKQYVAQLNKTESFVVEAELNPISQSLTRNVTGTIFSIIQEAVNNAKRHSKASIIKIIVITKADQLLVHIKDNGVGFNVNEVENNYSGRTSLGLLNMKERAELIEGILAINSETSGSKRGTTITLSMPLKTGTKPLNKSLLQEEKT